MIYPMRSAKQSEIPSYNTERSREQVKARERRTRNLALGAIGLALGGTLLVVAAVGATGGPSYKSPDKVEAFTTFTIGPNTHMRSSHTVGNGADNNLYASLDETITLKAKP